MEDDGNTIAIYKPKESKMRGLLYYFVGFYSAIEAFALSPLTIVVK